MNFNYDLATWIDYFIGAFACCFGSFIIAKILLNKKINEISKWNYVVLIFLTMITIINTLIFDNVSKIFGVLIVLFCIYKVIFKQRIYSSIEYAIITYVIFLLGDLTVALVMSILLLFLNFNALDAIIKTTLGNGLVVIFTVIYSKILANIINKILSKLKKSKIFYILVIGVVTLFVLLSSLYKLALNNWIISYEFILDTVMFIGGIILTFILLKQYIDNNEITYKYNLLNDYLKTSANLIEKYSTTVHKYKNNLIAIKSYLNKNNLYEAESYIDNLIGIYDNKKYNWFKKINYIKIDSLRYLIYYKLSKAEGDNLKISVDVSPDIKKYENDLLTVKDSNILLEIVGEYFDNAIYASEESKNKELNLIIYKEDNKMKLLLSNTYLKNVDLSVITKNGYTTKGKGHGLGLYDIDKTINKNKWIKVNYEIVDEYFVVNLELDFDMKIK